MSPLDLSFSIRTILILCAKYDHSLLTDTHSLLTDLLYILHLLSLSYIFTHTLICTYTPFSSLSCVLIIHTFVWLSIWSHTYSLSLLHIYILTAISLERLWVHWRKRWMCRGLVEMMEGEQWKQRCRDSYKILRYVPILKGERCVCVSNVCLCIWRERELLFLIHPHNYCIHIVIGLFLLMFLPTHVPSYSCISQYQCLIVIVLYVWIGEVDILCVDGVERGDWTL